MFRNIVNFFIDVLILNLASCFFPDCCRIAGWKCLLISTLVIWGITMLIILAMYIVAAIGVGIFNNPLIILVAIIVVLLSPTLSILALSYLEIGFWVNGFWTALIIGACTCVFSFRKPEREESSLL